MWQVHFTVYWTPDNFYALVVYILLKSYVKDVMGRSGLYIRVCLGMDINQLYDKGRDLNLSGSQFPELKNEGIFRLIFLFHLFLFLLLISNTKLNNCTTQCMVHHHILLSKVTLQFYFIFYFIPNLHSFHSMDNQSNTFNICTCICKIYIF